ncbi:hypothetical protein [Desulfotomaculum sp. OF05-3]|jgi:hypothetical protein|uniref:hypothetical protein n=1 Tax=Desulfotomaculum sp. OF05-3 TaxID=2305243 RepID=UPI000E413968|nr:hypothetical protein [Desulfotomaculum sp. OF05-3]RGE18230.1 hypothetical protein DXA87_00800 [Desulfotomaculum sp. OF05-3]
MKTAIYVRTKQDNAEESLSGQKEKVCEFCAGQEIPAYTEREGITALDILKKDMKDGRIETVITTKENRKYVEER